MILEWVHRYYPRSLIEIRDNIKNYLQDESTNLSIQLLTNPWLMLNELSTWWWSNSLPHQEAVKLVNHYFQACITFGSFCLSSPLPFWSQHTPFSLSFSSLRLMTVGQFQNWKSQIVDWLIVERSQEVVTSPTLWQILIRLNALLEANLSAIITWNAVGFMVSSLTAGWTLQLQHLNTFLPISLTCASHCNNRETRKSTIQIKLLTVLNWLCRC